MDNQQVLSKAKDDLINLYMCISQEETYWRQKAHVKWLLEGDQNTQFFHSVVQQKRSSTFIKELEDAQGNLVSDSSHLPTMITDYYQSLFSSQVTAEDSALLDLIPSIITSEHNSMLLAPPSIEEVREVVFGLSADSAPGPDDFSGQATSSEPAGRLCAMMCMLLCLNLSGGLHSRGHTRPPSLSSCRRSLMQRRLRISGPLVCAILPSKSSHVYSTIGWPPSCLC